MAANLSEPQSGANPSAESSKAPKKITNAQTVCNERNEKGKLCNGHLKQIHTGGEDARVHVRGDDVLFKCNQCGTYYMGPPLGHLSDPRKMKRFVERDLSALLQAAGGTLPAFVRNEHGALVQVSPQGGAHASAAAKPAAAAPVAAPAAVEETVEQKRARKLAESAAKKAASPAIPGASGPPPSGETPEQKLARLKAVVAEAKRRKEAGETPGEGAAPAAIAATPAVPSVASAPAAPVKAAPAARPASSGPVPGETPAQKIARLQAVVAEAKRRKEAGEGPAPASPAAAKAAPASKAAAPGVESAAPTAVATGAKTEPRAAAPSGPVPGETPEQKIARLQAVVAEAKRRKEAGEGPAPAGPVAAKPAVKVEAPPAQVAAPVEPLAAAAPAIVEKKVSAAPSGPVPGETHEQKIARLQAVVAAAKQKAGKS